MKIFRNEFFKLSSTSIILGFFDGIHLGHREVINSAINFAKKNNTKTLLITFKTSPAGYFNKNIEYIFDREDNYKLIENLGVDYLLELDFSEYIDMKADDFLKFLKKNFSPKSISTGFNYSFGKNREGSPSFLEKNQNKYEYKYFCIPEYKINSETVSSTNIKKALSEGNLIKANQYLSTNFKLKSTIIKGKQLGRKIGFPTANMKYPENITKIPYGVYKIKTLSMPAILNWGVKPTIDGKEEILEIHIPNFNNDLYNKELEIELLAKIRDEKKFDSIEELKKQIKKDIECLK